MPNGFVTKSSAPASRASTLARSVSRTESTMIGMRVQPRSPRMTSTPSMPGKPEVEDDEVGVLARGERQRRLARRREVDLVTARLQVRPERAQQLRLVVDDEDAAHSAARSRSTIVRPPPGVSSTSIVAAHRLDEALGDGETEAHALAVRRVAETLERHEHAVALVARHPRAPVGDADVDEPVDRAGGDPGVRALGREANGVLDDVRERALEQPGIGEDARQRLGDVELDVSVFEAEAVECGREDLLEPDRHRADLERASLDPAHVEEVPDERVEPVGLLVDRVQELAPLVVRPLDVLLEEARRRTP